MIFLSLIFLRKHQEKAVPYFFDDIQMVSLLAMTIAATAGPLTGHMPSKNIIFNISNKKPMYETTAPTR